jgi:hypothetical protein
MYHVFFCFFVGLDGSVPIFKNCKYAISWVNCIFQIIGNCNGMHQIILFLFSSWILFWIRQRYILLKAKHKLEFVSDLFILCIYLTYGSPILRTCKLYMQNILDVWDSVSFDEEVVWLVAGLFWERSTADWLLVIVCSERTTAGWLLISQMNRPYLCWLLTNWVMLLTNF